MRNYVMCGKKFFGRRLLYAFLDVPENLAASVLDRHRVHCGFLHVLTRENEEYVLIQVKVRRKEEQRFLAAMEDLKKKMLIFGHTDYETHGGKLIRELEDIMIEKAMQDEKLLRRMGIPVGMNIMIVDEPLQETGAG